MLVAIQTPDQVTQQREQEAEAARLAAQPPAQSYQNTQPAEFIAKHVRSCWEVAKSNRIRINPRLIDCLRRRAGEYAPEKKAQLLAQNQNTIYMMLTAAKCHAAKAWLSDLFNPAGDRAWTLEPTPIADLPPDVMQQLVSSAMQGAEQMIAHGMDAQMAATLVQQLVMKHQDRLRDETQREAERRAERMGNKIEDLLIEADWNVAFDEFLDDLSTFPAGILKGLEFRRQKRLMYMQEGGKFVPKPGFVIAPKVRRVSPFRAYPSPAAGNTLRGHWFIEHHTFTRTDLANMRGAPGYNAEAIAYVLAEFGNAKSGLREWVYTDLERATLEGREHFIFNSGSEIDALEWSGPISGRQLLEWGIPDTEITDRDDEYQVSVMVVGNYVIRALVNPDPLGLPDYMRACWKTIPGAFWGRALPELMADSQDVCNATARSLVVNMAMSSGPQVWVEMDRVALGADVKTVAPWKIWYSNNNNASGGPGVGFFQPQSNAQELMAIYERFSNYADEMTGLPKFAYGSDQGAGAAKTMGGLSMLMNAASKTVKDVVRGIDMQIISPTITKFFNFVMLNDPDDSLKGDLVVKARGSEALVHKEQAAMRQQELLAMTANPIDMQIMGPEGRLEMLREVVKTGAVPVDRVLPTREEFAQRMSAEVAAQQGQPPALNDKEAA